MEDKIKFCVWDVGNVIYPYSLKPLDEWFCDHSQNLDKYLSGRGVFAFNYNDYMKGVISDSGFCQRLCEAFDVPFDKEAEIGINKALHQGIGKKFKITQKMMNFMAKNKIENVILSNALPLLAGSAGEEIKPEYKFTSFDLGMLKPDPEIYETVRRRLGCKFEEMIFVDDKERNVTAASELGIYAVVFHEETLEKDLKNILLGTGTIRMKTKEKSGGR